MRLESSCDLRVDVEVRRDVEAEVDELLERARLVVVAAAASAPSATTGFDFGAHGAGELLLQKWPICGSSRDHFDTSTQCLVNMSAAWRSVTT